MRPGDCLVLNDTRVVPARLVGVRTATGGRWEGLFLEASPEGALAGDVQDPGQAQPGETHHPAQRPTARTTSRLQLGGKQPDGIWIARPRSTEETFALLERVGRVPLPPYIRKGEMVEADRERLPDGLRPAPGAVAAPTAGLHFTEALLDRLEDRGR